MDLSKMTHWGIGPKAVMGTLLTALAAYCCQYVFFRDFRIDLPLSSALIIGIAWFSLGIPIWLCGAIAIKDNYKQGKLVTCGIFSYIQHPIYCAFIFFYLPAVAIMTRSYPAFAMPVVFYLIFARNIVYEEKYLEEKFSGEYLEYKNKTGCIFPKLFAQR